MSTITNNSVQTKESFIQKYPLASFFLLAIGLTWIFMITDALGSHNILPFRLPLPLMIVMGYMPTLGAVIVTQATQGKEGVKALFRKLLIARVGLRWYLFAIFGIAVAFVTSIEIYNMFGNGPALPILSTRMPQMPLGQLALSIVPMFIVFTLVNGEELAWRGFALPRLQAKYNALTSSLILGVIWTLFHLPLFFTLTGSSQADWSFISFLISTVSLSVLYTWMYNHTRGSVLLAYLFHGAANTWTQILSIDHNGVPFVGWTMTGLTLLIAVIVVITSGAENLSRTVTRIQE
jgi:membrane protease YdiL (CAAX protease family)